MVILYLTLVLVFYILFDKILQQRQITVKLDSEKESFAQYTQQ